MNLYRPNRPVKSNWHMRFHGRLSAAADLEGTLGARSSWSRGSIHGAYTDSAVALCTGTLVSQNRADTSASASQVKPIRRSPGTWRSEFDGSSVGGTSCASTERTASATPRCMGRWGARYPPDAPAQKARACPFVKPVREPDARDPHVRFDERRRERSQGRD
jgi:hypothetical protein